MKKDELREVMIDLVSHLAAAVSLLEHTPKAKKAAPSDKMFRIMLDDYRGALARGRQFFSDHLEQK